MTLCIVHLSDVHFATTSNVIETRSNRVVSAILACSSNAEYALIIVSGDIAQSGSASEYDRAHDFLTFLTTALKAERPTLTTHILTVPGNHDCQLPIERQGVRHALISGLEQTLDDAHPDAELLTTVLADQSNYRTFSSRFHAPPSTTLDMIVNVHKLTVGPHSLSVYLYNTALLSRRDEVQGSLKLPIKWIKEHIYPDPSVTLAVSVFHHPYNWLDANIAVEFRSHVESTSEITLTGHQHYNHSYTKHNLTGETLAYFEGHPLQETGHSAHSGFSVLIVDLATLRLTPFNYEWKNDMYSSRPPHQEQLLTPARALASRFTLLPEFKHKLDDSGLGLFGGAGEPLLLSDTFVYPDTEARPFASFSSVREIPGSSVLQFFYDNTHVFVAGAPLTGKSALTRMVFLEFFRTGRLIPLLISGDSIIDAKLTSLEALVDRSITQTYGSHLTERFWQLDRGDRVLFVDDWQKVKLKLSDRRNVLNSLSTLFGRLIIVGASMFQVEEYIPDPTSDEGLPPFQHLTIRSFGHAARGRLIDRWLDLKRDRSAPPADLSRETEDAERAIITVIGKNILPSIPFILIALLEALEQEKTNLPEAGSFGYLYEVLITAALSSTSARKAQIDKKYTFLGILAFHFFNTESALLDRAEIERLLADYSARYRVAVDNRSLIEDLVVSRVLSEENGTFAFYYPHYYFYFLARYIREHLYGGEGQALRGRLNKMVKQVTNVANKNILMFVIYLTKDQQLIDEIASVATKIFTDLSPARLDQEVDFLFTVGEKPKRHVLPRKIDLEQERHRRRCERDENERRGAVETATEIDVEYSDGLPLVSKVSFALRYIEVLGQVLRNFPGSLPGETKLKILRTAYTLGLRNLTAVLKILGNFCESWKLRADSVDAASLSEQERKKFTKQLELFDRAIFAVSQMWTVGIIKDISLSVGVADLDQAYAETLESVGRSNATRILDLSIKLDHFEDFPYSQIEQLHRDLKFSPFASMVLRNIVYGHLLVLPLERRMRERVAKLFDFKSEQQRKFLDNSRKRF